MLVNWLVKTKQIRNSGTKFSYKKIKLANGKTKFERVKGSGRKIKNGFANHVNYLHDSSRPAHQQTEIHILLDNAKNILKAVNDRKEQRERAKLKGGHLYNVATSFVLSLPLDIKQPSVDQWAKIGDRLIDDISSTTGIPHNIVKKHTHIVLHAEYATEGKHSHIHVLVSNVINCQVIKKITQRATTSAIKKGFNESVKLILGEDNAKYTPLKSSVPDKPLWLARQEKAEQLEKEISSKQLKLKRLNHLYKILIDKISTAKNDIAIWAKSFLNNIFTKAEVEAENVANSISIVEQFSEHHAKGLTDTVKAIEQENLDAPKSVKPSHKKQS